MRIPFRIPPGRGKLPGSARVLGLLACAALLGGCADPATMIASSVVTAAVRTAMDQAEKAKPSPEERWRQARLDHMQRRAAAGDAEAQYILGTYYLRLREPQAQGWICRAANAGDPRAQLLYGHWYNEDRLREDMFEFIPVRPDNATAYMWYQRAADSGEPRAALFRDSLAVPGMPAGERERGRTRAVGWAPGPCSSVSLATASSRSHGAGR